MNVVFLFASVLMLPSFTYSLQDIFQLKPSLRKIYHYELFHPKLSAPVSRSVVYRSNPVEISTRFPPSFLASLKVSSQPPSDVINNLFQQEPRSENKKTRALISGYLFTPNTINESAITVGQLENYKKDLEEKAKEEEQEQNSITSNFENSDIFRGKAPRLHVSVNGGLYNYNYTV